MLMPQRRHIIQRKQMNIMVQKMKRKIALSSLLLALVPAVMSAQYRTDLPAGSGSAAGDAGVGAAGSDIPELETELDTSATPLTLQDALKIALSENVAVKVADKEIERSQYAKKGTYASLFPQIDVSGSYQRTIKKQVMYMDSDGDSGGSIFSSIMPYFSRINELSAAAGMDPVAVEESSSSSSSGFAVGRWNTFNVGLTASMPLVNAQLWKSIEISGKSVELAVEQARSSRLDMVTQVKQAYYAVLLAKEVFDVYKDVYENAVENFEQTQREYRVSRASELEYTRAKTNVANAVPNVYNAESQIVLALWQLKAVMGVDLDMNIDVTGKLSDYSEHMFYDIHQHDSLSLDNNTSMRQLAIQAEQLAETVKMQKYAYLPTLSAAFSYSQYAMENEFNFSEYHWTPYSYAGISVSIPIFSGGKRYNDVRQAKVQAVELDLQRVNTERQLKIAVRQYLSSMETAMKSYTSAVDAEDLARKAYDITSKSYNVGKSTLTDLNDAQLALTQAQLAVSQAIYNFVVAKSNLEQTLGADFIDDNGNVTFDSLPDAQ